MVFVSEISLGYCVENRWWWGESGAGIREEIQQLTSLEVTVVQEMEKREEPARV